jgi:apolipoprotein N-acyltransferase
VSVSVAEQRSAALRSGTLGFSLAAVLAGIAIGLTFPPVGWWWLAPVGYAPLLWAWRHSSPGRAAVLGLIGGAVAAAIVCSWMWYFGSIAYVPFALAMSCGPAIAGYVLALLGQRGIRGPGIEAVVWVAAEGLLARFPFGGMPWMAAGNPLAPLSALRALAPWGGVAVVSLLVLVVNGLVLDLVSAGRNRVPRAAVRAAASLGAVALVVILAYGSWPTTSDAGPLRYALLQGNDLNRRLTATELGENYLRESHFALAAQLEGHFDLIVFPESSLGGDDPETDRALRDRIVALAARHQSWVMVNVDEVVGSSTFNTNRIYDPQGELVASYRKQHLVPFGEYLPFAWVRTIAPQIEQIGSGYDPGTTSQTVEIAGHPVTTIICFETAFSPLVRSAAANGAEGIVLSTNNRSYRRSANSAQHVQLSQWRSAELGRPTLHAAISGISASIDARGRVEQRTELFARTTLTGSSALQQGTTPYARLGDWVTLGCALATLAGVVVCIIGRTRAERPPA